MRWFRLYTDILDDPKMFELTEFQFRIFVMLMALASRLDKDGSIDMSERGLRVSIHCSKPGKALPKVLHKLNQLGIISSSKLPFKFVNWNKRQCKSDISATRVQKHRKMKRVCNVTETAKKRTVDTDTDTDTDNTPPLPPKGCGNFEKFWRAYPKRIGRGAAEKAWKKIKPNESLLQIMLTAITNFENSEQWQKDGGQYIPNPATWLNQKRWEDELLSSLAGSQDEKERIVAENKRIAEMERKRLEAD